MFLIIRFITKFVFPVFKKSVGKLYSKSGKITQCMTCDIKKVI